MPRARDVDLPTSAQPLHRGDSCSAARPPRATCELGLASSCACVTGAYCCRTCASVPGAICRVVQHAEARRHRFHDGIPPHPPKPRRQAASEGVAGRPRPCSDGDAASVAPARHRAGTSPASPAGYPRSRPLCRGKFWSSGLTSDPFASARVVVQSFPRRLRMPASSATASSCRLRDRNCTGRSSS